MSVKSTVAAIAFALGLGSPLYAAVAYSPCTDFLVGSVNGMPLVGQLVCWAELTWTSGWGHVSGSTETQYEGYYRFGDRTVVIDCETGARIR